MLGSAVSTFTKTQFPSLISSKTLSKLSKFLFFRVSIWWLLLLLDKNGRPYERCIKRSKQTTLIQFSILINDNDLRKNNLHETSNRTALIEQRLVVRNTPC